MKPFRFFLWTCLGLSLTLLTGCSADGLILTAVSTIIVLLLVIFGLCAFVVVKSVQESFLSQTSVASAVVGGFFKERYTKVLPAKFTLDTLLVWPFEQVKFIFPSGLFEVEFGNLSDNGEEKVRTIVVQDKNSNPVFAQDVTIRLEFRHLDEKLLPTDGDTFDKFCKFCQQIAAGLGEQNPFVKKHARWRFDLDDQQATKDSDWKASFEEKFSKLFAESVMAIIQKVVRRYTTEEISSGLKTDEITSAIVDELKIIFDYKDSVFSTVELVVGDFSPSRIIQAAEEQKRARVIEAEGRREALDILAEADFRILQLQTLEKVGQGASNTVVLPAAVTEILGKLGGLSGDQKLQQAAQVLSPADQARVNVAGVQPDDLDEIRTLAINELLSESSGLIEALEVFLDMDTLIQQPLIDRYPDLGLSNLLARSNPLAEVHDFVRDYDLRQLSQLIKLLKAVQNAC